MASTRRGMRLLAVLAAGALLATACGSDDTTDGGDDPGTTTDGGDSGDSGDSGDPGDSGGGEDLSGTNVAIFGAFTSVEADAVNAAIDQLYEAQTGGEAFYEGSDSFEEQIKIRVEGGNPPDIALYPQPGAVVQQAQAGNAVALEDLGFDISELEATFGEYLLSLGEYEGKHYGLPTNVNSKSLVWYNLPVFEAQGYAVPDTWDDMISLSETMVADGFTPFCIGTGSDAATGWTATDWMEDIMLRTAGADVYDQWVAHEIPFNAPEVKRAAEVFAEVAFNEDFIVGRTANIPDLDFRDAPDGLVTPSVDDPSCLLHRQASFITNFFPDGTVVGTDVSAFPFPAIDAGVSGNLIGGELAAIFDDRPEVRSFIERFIAVETQCAIGSSEGVQRISPNINVGGECYTDEIVAAQADSITEALAAGGARFDASDLMPTEVGSGSFWTGMNEWMRGKDLDSVLADIEASWPG